jgi:hypothetical protein
MVYQDNVTYVTSSLNKTNQTLSFFDVQQSRSVPNAAFSSTPIILNNAFNLELANVINLNNSVDAGLNIVQELAKYSNASPTRLLQSNTYNPIAQFTPIYNALLNNYTIYNYKKTLINYSIFGKSFEADFQVKCYLLVYIFSHDVQCIGEFDYTLFGNSKSITVFNFKQSITLAWNWSQSYSGNWGFTVWLGLPSPVNFLGINFSFNVNYNIAVTVTATTSGGNNPFNYKVGAVATTVVTTNAQAGVRAVVIEGGAFIAGTLVSAGTDPTVTLAYYIPQRKINVLAQWYFWINAFNFKWGFYYKTWSLWSGWSGMKIISQWTINGVYGKWNIINQSWTIYV